MRSALILLAKAYPRAWRERYGVEFDALMEDVEPDLREFINVLGGAVKLRLRNETAIWKVAGVTAILGMLAAAGISRLAPQRYVSTAHLRVIAPEGGGAGKDQDLRMLLLGILSRGSLMEIISRPSLSLYPGERQRVPMEDVIRKMRRDIQVVWRDGSEGLNFSVSFAYPDRFKAREVTRALAVRYLEQNLAVARNREQIWRQAWKEHAPPAGKMELLTPASDPGDPAFRLATFLAWGAGAGLMLGLLVFAVTRWPRMMRQLAICGLAGCALGGAASFLIPEVYVSEAVMRITPPVNPQRWYAGKQPEPASSRVERMKRALWSTLKDGGDQHISIAILGDPTTTGTFHISATAGSANQAQSRVRAVVTDFMEQFAAEERTLQGDEIRFMAAHKLGPNLEVLDPASSPATPAKPNRVTMAILGLLAGLLAGAVWTWIGRPPAPSTAGTIPQPI